MIIDDFRAECIALGKKWLPGYEIRVSEFDCNCLRGVAIIQGSGDTMLRHAVRGRAIGRWSTPPWWKFWRKPVFLPALSPQQAIGALAKWVIERDFSCQAPLVLEDNEEPLK